MVTDIIMTGEGCQGIVTFTEKLHKQTFRHEIPASEI